MSTFKLRSVGAGALAAVTLALAIAGCTRGLKPAPEAETVPGEPLAAVTEAAGVRMIVEPGAWGSNPTNLEQRVLPLKVTIRNDSNQPVRVRYRDFTLDAGDVQLKPLPPLDITGRVTERADRPVYLRSPFRPHFVYRGFLVAPWYTPYYLGLHPWDRPWALDSFYYQEYYPRWEVDLPTQDMIEQAIPEGVIQPGGAVTGFLYFPKIAGKPERVIFKAELMNGANGERLGTLELPFDYA